MPKGISHWSLREILFFPSKFKGSKREIAGSLASYYMEKGHGNEKGRGEERRGRGREREKEKNECGSHSIEGA